MKFDPVPGSTPEEIKYHNYHLKRLKYAYELIMWRYPGRILEVGPFTLTYWLRQNSYQVDTLGFDIQTIRKNEWDVHYDFNLNDIMSKSFDVVNKIWLRYDMVICCEVIEHLIVNMPYFFNFLYRLTIRGGTVLIQTPNAVSLKRRMVILSGKNPYDQVIHTWDNSHMHIREYTMDELKHFAKLAGFEIELATCRNYFSYNHSKKAKAYEIVCNMLPQSLRDGITLLLKKPL